MRSGHNDSSHEGLNPEILMYFGSYSSAHRREIEDVYLPGDKALYEPVVLRSRREGRGAYYEDLIEILKNQWYHQPT
jgi:hypothetical protein